MLPLRLTKKPLKVEDAMKLLCKISENKKVKVALRYTLESVLITSAGAFIGAVFGGPSGILVGKCKLLSLADSLRGVVKKTSQKSLSYERCLLN